MYEEAGNPAHCYRPALPELSYLSEDEAGGGGAAVRALQPAASGVGPSVGLGTNRQCFKVIVWLDDAIRNPFRPFLHDPV